MNEDKVLSAFRAHGSALTTQDVAALLAMSWHGAERLLRRMASTGVLRIDKRADVTWYELPQQRQQHGNDDAELIRQLAAVLGPEVAVELTPGDLRDKVTAYPGMLAARLIVRCQAVIRPLLGETGILFQYEGRRTALLQRCSLAFIRESPILRDEQYQAGYLAGNTR
jgi:hypothetical protein